MAVQVMETMSIHESVVLRLLVGLGAGGEGACHHGVHRLTALATEGHEDFDAAFASAMGLVVKVANKPCVISMT